jgi:hypothetical protein
MEMIEFRPALPPPLPDFSEVHYVDGTLARRRLLVVAGLSLCFALGVLIAASHLLVTYRLERDAALGMAVTRTVTTATTATAAAPAKSVQVAVPPKLVAKAIAPMPPSVSEPKHAADARVVLLATVFDRDSALALKDEVAEAVRGCEGIGVELCVKPVRGGESFAALATSRAGLVPAEASRLASCFKEKQNKEAIVVAANKYRSAECL